MSQLRMSNGIEFQIVAPECRKEREATVPSQYFCQSKRLLAVKLSDSSQCCDLFQIVVSPASGSNKFQS